MQYGLGQFIDVQVEFPVEIEDVDGTKIRLLPDAKCVYFSIPTSAYRRNAWMGIFKRRLRLVRGYGRTYYLDESWRELAASMGMKPGGIPVAAVESRRRGCGCGGGVG